MTRPHTRLDDLPALPADRGGPVFQEPWQASAFALAVHLSERGAFPWTEWSAALGREIREAAAGGDSAQVDAYFRHWLAALERLCADKGMVESAELRGRQDEWRRAYLNTHHGEPVQLAAARESPPARRRPA
jgi:nitrile hydratase accessory protein